MKRRAEFHSRRDFLRRAASAVTVLAMGRLPVKICAADKFQPALGVCAAVSKHAAIKSAGFAFIEEKVGSLLIPLAADSEFKKKCAEVEAASLPVRACNNFIPADMKIVGPSVDLAALLRYTETAFRRAKQLEIKRIVLGSGGARKSPEGFDAARAKEQFLDFCRRIALQAAAHDVTIVLEPLNREETNLLNRVDEGCEFVDAIAHPNVQLMADLFHMLREDESAESLRKAGRRLRHCHVAEKKNRTAPGVDGDDFRSYLKVLKAIGYTGGISLECRLSDLEKELPPARRTMEEQLATS